MVTLSARIPQWLIRFLMRFGRFAWLRDLEVRTALTGKASVGSGGRLVSTTFTMQRRPE